MIESGKPNVSKPLININSKPIIIHCLKTLNGHPSIRDIVVVSNPETSQELISKIRQYRIGKISRIVRGGRRRQDSVSRGLKAIDRRADLVLIHDGARPFIGKNLISALITEAKRSGAAIAGVPVKATIKEIAYRKSHIANRIIVKKTLDRDNLWQIQTPQVFKKELILRAYEKFGNTQVTDDAMLVEKLGAKVSIVLGSYNNIKITTPEDLVFAEAIAKKLIKKG